MQKDKTPVQTTTRAWDGTPVTAEWVADSLDRYSKIKPGGGRDIWAMQEGAKVIRKQAAEIERLKGAETHG